MGLRTYLPMLVFIVTRICKYTARYDSQIRHHLTEGQLPAYNALRTACDAFVAIMGTFEVGD